MTAPHDTQRRGRRWTVQVCEKCGRALGYDFNLSDHRWACGGKFHAVEVAPVQSEGEREVTDDMVEAGARALMFEAKGLRTRSRPPKLWRDFARAVLEAAFDCSPPTTQEARTDG